MPVYEGAEDCDQDYVETFDVYAVSGGSLGNYVVEVTLTDACGNSSSLGLVYQLVDTTAPELTVGPGVQLECGAGPPEPAVYATDDCTEVEISFSDEFIPGSGCNDAVFVRTYVAEDTSGNTSIEAVTYPVVDTSPPVITWVGDDIAYDCDDGILGEMESSIQVFDCTGYSVTMNSYISGEACPYTYHLDVTAEDPCGNIAIANYVVEPQASGCTDPAACNYAPWAAESAPAECYFPGDACDDYSEWTGEPGACSCTETLHGVVFVDADYDGSIDFNEAPLPMQTVTVVELGISTTSDDDGEFDFGILPEGTYTVEVSYATDWLAYTTPTSFTVTVNGGSQPTLKFGVADDEPIPQFCLDFYPSGTGMPCNDEINFNVCYRNLSAFAFAGKVEIILDPLLTFSESDPVAEEVDGQTITWYFDPLDPWVMNVDDIYFYTPSELYIGEFTTSYARVYAEVDGEYVLVVENELELEVTCAYDPNDITGFTNGYTEEHYVLEDTRMEYLIRFQNTGNAPASNITVVDTLDAFMDPSTFQVVANSHSVQTTLYPSGRIEFFFPDIQLPDSTCCEPLSHGLVSFKVDLIDGLEPGDEFNQTAYIYFDNNPPVITNTTWHTVFDCDWMDYPEPELFCNTPEVALGLDGTFVTDYTWWVDGVPAGEPNAPLLLDGTQPNTYTVTAGLANPLCAIERTFEVEVTDYFPEDINLSLLVDGQDILATLGDWGCLEECLADVDQDGTVGAQDLLMVLGALGQVCGE